MMRWLGVLAAAAIAGDATASPPDWQWDHPAVHNGGILAIYGRGTTVHAAGVKGTLLVSKDAGATWAAIASHVADDLHAIGGDGTLVVVVGDRGTILRSTDGTTFAARPSPTTESIVDVAVHGGAVFAVASDGSVLRSTNGGDSFVVAGQVTTGFSARAHAIAMTDGGAIVVASDAGLWRSRNDGATFSQTIAEPTQSVRVASDGTVHAVAGTRVTYHSIGSCGTCLDASYETMALYRSTDDGVKWKRRRLVDPTTTAKPMWGAPFVPAPPATPPPGSLRGHRGVGPPSVMPPFFPRRTLTLAPGGTIYVVADRMHVSSDRGATFGERRARGPVVAALSATAVIAGGATLARSTDRGTTWIESVREKLIADDQNLFALAATPSGRVFAAGMGGTIASRGATTGWSRVATPTDDNQRLHAIHALDDDVVIAVGDGGLILQSRDGGKTFRHRASDQLGDLTAVWGSGRDVFAAGRHTLLHSRDRGDTWTSIDSDLFSARAIWGRSAGDMYLVGDTVVHSRDRGKTWRAVDKSWGGIYGAIWGDGNDVVLVGIQGKILHSRDRGKRWTARKSGTTEELVAVWGHGDEVFAVGGSWSGGHGVVLRSRDRGKTWAAETVPVSQHIFDVAGTGDAVFILGAGAAILRRSIP